MTNADAFDALLAELGDVPPTIAALGRSLAADIDAADDGVNAALVAQYRALLEGLVPVAAEDDTVGDMLAQLRDKKATRTA